MKNAKILEGEAGSRDQGLGDISHDLILKRAGELALADGRLAEDYTDDDYARAEAELRGDEVTADEAPEGTNGVRLPEEAASTSGHKAGNPFEGDENISAKLVEEGVNEAVHDEFVESGRATIKDAGDDEEVPRENQ